MGKIKNANQAGAVTGDTLVYSSVTGLWTPDHGTYAPAGHWKSGKTYGRAPKVTTVAQGAGTMTLSRLVVPAAVTINQISVQVTGAIANAVGRVGIYSSDASDYPGSLLLEATSGAQLDFTTNGVKTVTISQALTAGVYWVAAASQVASATLRSWDIGDPQVGLSSATEGLSATDTPGYYQGGVTGAFPSSLTLDGTTDRPYALVVRAA